MAIEYLEANDIVIDEVNSDYDDEPDNENDAFITDVTKGGYDVSISGKYIGHVDEMDAAIELIEGWKEKNKFYPNTWFINDHGNISLMGADGNLMAKGGKISKEDKVTLMVAVGLLGIYARKRKESTVHYHEIQNIIKQLKENPTDQHALNMAIMYLKLFKEELRSNTGSSVENINTIDGILPKMLQMAERTKMAKGGNLKSDPIWHYVGLNQPPKNFTPAAENAFKEALEELQAVS